MDLPCLGRLDLCKILESRSQVFPEDLRPPVCQFAEEADCLCGDFFRFIELLELSQQIAEVDETRSQVRSKTSGLSRASSRRMRPG